jgi:hypothetical protein
VKVCFTIFHYGLLAILLAIVSRRALFGCRARSSVQRFSGHGGAVEGFASDDYREVQLFEKFFMVMFFGGGGVGWLGDGGDPFQGLAHDLKGSRIHKCLGFVPCGGDGSISVSPPGGGFGTGKVVRRNPARFSIISRGRFDCCRIVAAGLIYFEEEALNVVGLQDRELARSFSIESDLYAAVSVAV